MNNYVLGYQDDEIVRLESQFKLLFDPSLKEFLLGSENVLEIGCGSGILSKLLFETNAKATYTGIDLDPATMNEAARRFSKFGNVRFEVMDGRALNFSDCIFDRVVIRLALWAVGPSWENVLEEAFRVLKPNGQIYSFEPEDRLLKLFPESKIFSSYLETWQREVISKGLNPFIGAEVHGSLAKIGFRGLETSIFSRAETGANFENFAQRGRNLLAIFMKESFDCARSISESDRVQIALALTNPALNSILIETYIANRAVKGCK